MIETHDLSKQFNNNFWAVDGVNLNVKEGQILALLGQNGAGKTTTIRMLTSLLNPTRGWARVAGYDAATQGTELRASVGVLTEQHGLYARMTGFEYLDFFGQVYSLTTQARKQRSEYLLEYFGLISSAKRRVGEYSKGMKQKLALARALIHEPPVLLLDEPTSAMDPESAQLVRNEIGRLRSTRRTILLCTHNLNEAEALSDSVAIIYRGKVLEQGELSPLVEKILGASEFEIKFSTAWNGRAHESIEGVSTIARDETSLKLRVNRPAEANPKLVEALTAQGASIVSIQESRHTLEQAYLKVMADAQEIGYEN